MMRTRLLVLACSLAMTGSAFAADVFKASLAFPWGSGVKLLLTDEIIPECPARYFATRLEIPDAADVVDCWTVEGDRIKILDRQTGGFTYAQPENFTRVTP